MASARELRNAVGRCRRKLAVVKREGTAKERDLTTRLVSVLYLYRHGDRSDALYENMGRVAGRGRG